MQTQEIYYRHGLRQLQKRSPTVRRLHAGPPGEREVRGEGLRTEDTVPASGQRIHPRPSALLGQRACLRAAHTESNANPFPDTPKSRVSQHRGVLQLRN